MKVREYYLDDVWNMWLKCWGCWEFKQLKDFHKSYNSFMGVCSKCKKCRNMYGKNYYKKNSEKYKENSKKWKVKNIDKVRAYGKNRRQRIPERIKEIYQNSIRKRDEKFWFKTSSLNYKAAYFINKNNLRPAKCPICKSQVKNEFHHINYKSEDMRSIWVFCCKRCHEKIHSWEIQCPNPINLLNLIN